MLGAMPDAGHRLHPPVAAVASDAELAVPGGHLEVEAVGERLARLDAKVAAVVRDRRAPATLRAYRADWQHFASWCARHQVAALPASPASIAAYLVDLADPGDASPGRKVSTLNRRLAAIGEAHQLVGHVSPTSSAQVRDAMKGLRRLVGVAQDQKRGVSIDDVRAAVAAMGQRAIDDRDRALILVGFAGGFRRSELAALDIDDMIERPAGIEVRLRRSKTDQEQAGRRVEVVYGAYPATCPVRAWRAWRSRAGFESGPAFLAIDRHGRIGPSRIAPRTVAVVVQRRFGALGLPIDALGGHSLRRGMATTAARAGASERTIMAATGHTATATLRSYIAEADEWTDPASSYLGL